MAHGQNQRLALVNLGPGGTEKPVPQGHNLNHLALHPFNPGHIQLGCHDFQHGLARHIGHTGVIADPFGPCQGVALDGVAEDQGGPAAAVGRQRRRDAGGTAANNQNIVHKASNS